MRDRDGSFSVRRATQTDRRISSFASRSVARVTNFQDQTTSLTMLYFILRLSNQYCDNRQLVQHDSGDGFFPLQINYLLILSRGIDVDTKTHEIVNNVTDSNGGKALYMYVCTEAIYTTNLNKHLHRLNICYVYIHVQALSAARQHTRLLTWHIWHTPSSTYFKCLKQTTDFPFHI